MTTRGPRPDPPLLQSLEALSSYELRAYLAMAHAADEHLSGIKSLRAILGAEVWHRQAASSADRRGLLERQAS
jgi:hypothetical protein